MAMIEQRESARGPVVEVAPGSSGGIAAVLRVAVPFSTIVLHAGRYEVPVCPSACYADAAAPRPASVCEPRQEAAPGACDCVPRHFLSRQTIAVSTLSAVFC